MKESILDVLLYLFEHYFANDAIVTGDDLTAHDSALVGELTEGGFSGAEIVGHFPVIFCYFHFQGQMQVCGQVLSQFVIVAQNFVTVNEV